MLEIHIVGLGPGNPGLMTIETLELLKNKDFNYFRTAIHPVMEFIEEQGISYESFDRYYETEETFEEVYEKIVRELIGRVKEKKRIVYAVPGNPLFGEETVVKLLRLGKTYGIECKVYSGVSFVDVTMNALEEDPIKGMKILDAFDFEKSPPTPEIDHLITQVYDRFMASELKLKLMEIYDSEKKVVLLINSGIPGKELKKEIPLWELDRTPEINHLTSLYIPRENNPYQGLNGTKEIMKVLRSKEGCSWDRAQTHESLKNYLLEESYEIIEAINNEDFENLVEELGDVLFQIIFHAEIARENLRFSMEDVIRGINEKMVRRHPHVFIDKHVYDPEKVESNWDAIKRMEKGISEDLEQNVIISEEMRAIPKALPSLMEAVKVQKKAAKIGFDWASALIAMDKIKEESEELKGAINQDNKEEIIEELGDLLFSVTNVSRLLNVQPELALREATQKFIGRINAMEKMCFEDGKNLKDCNNEALENLWKSVKWL